MSMQLRSFVRGFFLAAAVLALLSSLGIFFFLGGSQVAASSDGVSGTVQHLSWFESQGWWGVAILFIFATLYYGPLHFYQLGKLGRAALFGITVIALTMLAMLSIGFFYVLSGLCVLLGLILMGIDIFIKRNRAP